MSVPRDVRFLMVTPVDFPAMPRNNEHIRVQHYTRLGWEISVLYKPTSTSSRFRDLLRDTLTFRVRSYDRDGARFVEVDPPFNYFGGYRRKAEVRAASPARRSPWRLAAVRLLTPLAILRDLFAVPFFLLAAGWKLKGRYDVCFGMGPWGGLVGWALRAMGKVSVLVYIDRDYEAGLVSDGFRRSYTEAVELFGIRRADFWIYTSRMLAERRRRSVDREGIFVPNGVDWDRFERSRRAEKSGHTLIYVGNIISWSGLDHAIAAMPRIRAEFPDARLRIVGWGQEDYLAQLRRLAQELGVEACVEFLGRREPEELGEILAGAEVGLSNSEPVPFRRYACPLKVIEYMAAGIPVITTPDTEATDVVTRYDCGIAAPYSAEGVAEGALSLFRDPERYHALRRNGIEHSRALDLDEVLLREAEAITRGGPWPGERPEQR